MTVNVFPPKASWYYLHSSVSELHSPGRAKVPLRCRTHFNPAGNQGRETKLFKMLLGISAMKMVFEELTVTVKSLTPLEFFLKMHHSPRKVLQ